MFRYARPKVNIGLSGACPGGGLGPPPLEIKKQKKKQRSSVQILGYFTYILPFCQLFSERAPPEKLKSKKKKRKKKGFQMLGPPLQIPGHAPVFNSFSVKNGDV